jgi:hypothetical protein
MWSEKMKNLKTLLLMLMLVSSASVMATEAVAGGESLTAEDCMEEVVDADRNAVDPNAEGGDPTTAPAPATAVDAE